MSVTSPGPRRGPLLGGIARLAGRVIGGLARPVAAAPRALTAPLARAAAAPGPAVAVVRTSGQGARIAVFVPPPGLGPEIWGIARDATGATYGERIRDLLGWSTVELRIGSQPLAETSVALSTLLQQVVDTWPVEPERIVLVGYGAGGLTARGAAGLRRRGDMAWTDLLTEVICLGTPSYAVRDSGSPLPGVPVLTDVVGAVGRRVDEHLAGLVAVDDRVLDVPLLAGVDYLLVTDELTTRPNRVGRLVGELMWWRHRRVGSPRDARDLFPTARRVAVSTAVAPLVNHPDVHSGLLSWLA